MLRSYIELSKRIFLDRLTTDAQPLLQPANIDAGPGDKYVYAGVLNPYNFGIGGDCSGSNGIFIGAALLGPQHMSWGRQFSTETFPGPFAGQFRQVGKAEFLSSAAAIRVMIMHGGGGPDSHMACIIDGWHMESNGTYGICGGPITMSPKGINDQNSSIWNDWWVSTDPITEDTTRRQPMGYPKGFDYAGGRPTSVQLRAGGASFVCRYLNDGGGNLPEKQLIPSEFAELVAGGMPVVFNYETTAQFMLGGHDAGHADALEALNYIRSLPGVPGDWAPVVYFSADWDEAPTQDQAIFDFCDGASEVLGAEADGRRRVGLYGAYWITKRARDAGKIGYIWQTEAWSGGNIDSRVDIMQRNGLSFQTVGGTQCDIDEAHSDAFGQFILNPAGTPVISGPPPAPTETDPFKLWVAGATDRQLLEYLVAQHGPGDPTWASKGSTLRDRVWGITNAAAKAVAGKKVSK